MKKYLNHIISILLLTLCCMILHSCSSESNEESARIKVALREAGNQLLLKQRDSLSLILPVLEKHDNVFEMSFQSDLEFEPSELVSSIDSSFVRASLPSNYIVEVLQCSNHEVAYSYEMNVQEEQTLIPCSGRILPKSCYTIEVKFLRKPKESSSLSYMLYAFGILVFLFLLVIYARKNKIKPTHQNHNSPFAKIGSFEFYPEQNKLVKSAIEISLSKKECELLEILASQPNKVVKRDELTKKVWEDNGVIVGRSLDTYISKLRKKLKDDERIKITNVHGVGYKLEIS